MKVVFLSSLFFLSLKVFATGETNPTFETLKNMSFLVTNVDVKNSTKKIDLNNGKYIGPTSNETLIQDAYYLASEPILVMPDKRAYVVLWRTSGGSGHWPTINEVDFKTNTPTVLRAFPEINEDRIVIEKISINKKQLVLDVIRHRKEDPLCCPTKKDSIKYNL